MLPLLLLVVVLLLDHLIQLNDNPFVQSGILPLIGAALASGAAALAGNLIGTSSSNSKNMQINKMNNDFNAREAEKARQYQTEMWNKTNEWNSPKYRDWETDRKSTRLNSSHSAKSRMPSSA